MNGYLHHHQIFLVLPLMSFLSLVLLTHLLLVHLMAFFLFDQKLQINDPHTSVEVSQRYSGIMQQFLDKCHFRTQSVGWENQDIVIILKLKTTRSPVAAGPTHWPSPLLAPGSFLQAPRRPHAEGAWV